MKRYLRLVLVLLCAVLPDSPRAWADSPKLRTESGTHLGPIHLLSGDDSGRYLLTAGHDATVRIWDAPRGELLQTVYFERTARPDQQTLLAALSSDGQVLAAYHHPQGATEPPPKLVLSMWRTGQTVAQIEPEAAVVARFTETA